MITVSKKNKVLDTLAFLSLKYSKDLITESSVQAESGRIERAIEYFYIQDPAKNKKTALDYNEFVVDFVMKNYKEFVFGHGFLEYSDKILNNIKNKK